MTDKALEYLREKVNDIIDEARDEAYQAGSDGTNMELRFYTGEIMQEFKTVLAEREQAAGIIGRIKQLEVSEILPDFAFEVGCEWFVQGVKVPKYLARKISDEAIKERAKLLFKLQSPPSGAAAEGVE